ncbi:hypothetical protein B0H10DRAFT_1952199 [Mycena sp. CBHHK59/15]|nr:hypothetical protein B0H10DRAFT_1952199 [Mycena sp. CBHHK59/15]
MLSVIGDTRLGIRQGSRPAYVLYDSLAGSGTSSFSSYQHYSPVSTPIQPQVIEEQPHRALAPAPHPSRPAGTAHGRRCADGDVCNITGVQAGMHLRRDAGTWPNVLSVADGRGNVPSSSPSSISGARQIRYCKGGCARAPGVAGTWCMLSPWFYADKQPVYI